MALYVKNEVQEVLPDQPVVFDNAPCPCRRGFVLHRPGSGIFTLKGGNAQCPCGTTLNAEFNANIAVPEGTAAAPIAVALTIDGEPVAVTRAIVTPAAAGDWFKVTVAYPVEIPGCCCQNVAIENVLPASDATAIPIQVQNASLRFTRTKEA